MNVNEYQELAVTTLNPKLSRKEVLINSVMGLCGESGEAIDIVKKWMAQGHELDKQHLAKELGDIAWYLAEAATALEIPLEDIFQSNREDFHAVRRLTKKRCVGICCNNPLLGRKRVKENEIFCADLKF